MTAWTAQDVRLAARAPRSRAARLAGALHFFVSPARFEPIRAVGAYPSVALRTAQTACFAAATTGVLAPGLALTRSLHKVDIPSNRRLRLLLRTLGCRYALLR